MLNSLLLFICVCFFRSHFLLPLLIGVVTTAPPPPVTTTTQPTATSSSHVIPHKSLHLVYFSPEVVAVYVSANLPFSCTFESDLCGMLQPISDGSTSGDDFDWTRQTGVTDTSGTGPSGAQAGSFYIYTDASLPRQLGDRAV